MNRSPVQIRLVAFRVDKIISPVSAIEDSDWNLKLLVNVYKDADARNAKSPALKDGDGNVTEPEGSTGSGAVHLNDKIKNKEYKFSYDPDSEQGDLIALAYAKLKTHEDFSGASDV